MSCVYVCVSINNCWNLKSIILFKNLSFVSHGLYWVQQKNLWNDIFSCHLKSYLKSRPKITKLFSLVQKYYFVCARVFVWVEKYQGQTRPKCTPENESHRLWCHIKKGKERKNITPLTWTQWLNDCNSVVVVGFSSFFSLFLAYFSGELNEFSNYSCTHGHNHVSFVRRGNSSACFTRLAIFSQCMFLVALTSIFKIYIYSTT